MFWEQNVLWIALLAQNPICWPADSPSAMKAARHFFPCFQWPAGFWRITAGHCLCAAQRPMLRLL